MVKDTASNAAPTKAGFIRQFPTDTPADDIVALGAEAGFELTKKMIWTVQSEMRHPAKKKKTSAKKAAEKKPAKKKQAKKKPASKAKTSKKAKQPTTSKAAEQRLKALILQVGLARAEAVYDQLREQLDALLD